MEKNGSQDTELLLAQFNARNQEAFVSIYRLFFKELHLYAGKLWGDFQGAEDIVQDVFCDLWENRETGFETLLKIKAFLYIAISNRFRNHVDHLKVAEKYEKYAALAAKDTATEITESEMYVSLLNQLERLPAIYAEVLRLYLAGYEAEDIAVRLGIALQTVYNRRREAIRILRERMKVESR